MDTLGLELGGVLSQFQLHSDHTLVRHAHFPGIGMKHLLPKLTSRLRNYHCRASELIVPRPKLEVPIEDSEDITQSYFWPRLGKFFKKKDVIVAETGARLAFKYACIAQTDRCDRNFEFWYRRCSITRTIRIRESDIVWQHWLDCR